MLTVSKFVSGPWKQNGYLVSDGADAVAIDPGDDFEELRAAVATQAVSVHAVLNTHGHYDHLGGVARAVAEYGAPFHLHPGDRGLLPRANFYRAVLGATPIEVPTLDVELAGGPLRFGALALEVLHTPGHTPGSVCFAVAGCLFTGDTLLRRRAGRTDLPGGDPDLLEASLRTIAERYPLDTLVHPGHGDSGLLAEMLDGVDATTERVG